MAYFTTNIDKKFIKMVTDLGERTDIIAQLMLDDAGQILGDALEKEIRTKHTDSGELADSIEVSNPRINKSGSWTVWAYPAGSSKNKMKLKGREYSRSKSGRKSRGRVLFNSDKLFYIEYGTSKQPARPFLRKLMNSVQNEIMDNMQEIFNREVTIR